MTTPRERRNTRIFEIVRAAMNSTAVTVAQYLKILEKAIKILNRSK